MASAIFAVRKQCCLKFLHGVLRITLKPTKTRVHGEIDLVSPVLNKVRVFL